jgi:hypothetical protein
MRPQRYIEPTAEVAWRASLDTAKELDEGGRLVEAKLLRDGGDRHLRVHQQALGSLGFSSVIGAG